MNKLTVHAVTAVAAIMLPIGAVSAQQSFINPGHPEPECTMMLPDVSMPATYKEQGERVWPGYLAQWDSGEQCIPFMATENLIPADYVGGDYYVDEFTDAAIREKWAQCVENFEECGGPVTELAREFTRFEQRRTGTADSFGGINEEGEVDLADIRRPGYFASDPYEEPVGTAEAHTYTVEFTVPRDGFEREHLDLTDEIKLRGWYMRGDGVDDGSGQNVHALIVVNNGGGSEFTAIGHRPFDFDETTGEYVARNHGLDNEQGGAYNWRRQIYAFFDAGFDVLVVDRRGNGISGGRAGFNTAEQANDIFRMFEQLDSGEGLRILTPDGDVMEGAAAAGVPVDGGSVYDLPVVVYGYSRGSFTTQWFMHKNFVENCELGTTEPVCTPAVGLENVRGAIIGGPNAGGAGYRILGQELREGAARSVFNTTQLPDGDVLANLDKWPGLQIVSGTFDRVEGLEGSFDAYQRTTGLRDIVVFAGQHGTNRYPGDMQDWISQRMVAFATAAALGHDTVEGGNSPSDLRELVLSSPQFWEIGMSREGWERIER